MANLNTERTSYQQALRALLESLDLSGLTPSPVLPLRLTLINMVKIKLDEIVPEGEGIKYELDSEPNTSDPFDIYIDNLLDESAKNVLLDAPLEILNSVHCANAAVGSDNVGYVVIPDDFLRLVSFKMAEWEREVTKAITASNPKYKLQKNKFTRGGVSKPVVVFTQRISNDAPVKVLEYYSVNSSHEIEQFLYVKKQLAEDIQEDLRDSLTWMCASKILQNTSQLDLSKLALEQARYCYQKI